MALLHPTRWPELAPEFAAAKLLNEAHELLRTAPKKTDGAALAQVLIGQARNGLHVVTRNPRALEEFEARKAGTFSEHSQQQPQQQQPSQQDEQLRLQAEQIEALMRRLSELEDAQTAPTEPPTTEPDANAGQG